MGYAFVEVKVERNIGHDARESTAQEGVLAALFQLVALAALKLIQMRVYVINTAVLFDQLNRRFVADTAHAGDIIGGVAYEGLVIDELFRLNAEALHHMRDVVSLGRAAAPRLRRGRGQFNDDVLVNQL